MDDIRTDRLLIRSAREEDLDDFLSYRNDPTSMRIQSLEPMERQAAARFVARQAHLPEEPTGWIMFAVQPHGEESMIGEVGIFIPAVDAHTGDVGWSLKKSHQGRGYALEATRALLGYAFLRRNLHRVTAGCVASNAASLRLMNRLGMRCEGVTLESRLQAGQWVNEHKYALLRREWLNATPANDDSMSRPE